MNSKRFQADFLAKIGDLTSFRQLLDLVPDVAFFMKDRAGRFVLQNQRACEYCQVNHERETIGKTDYDFFPIPDAQGLQGGADWMMAFNDTPAVQALVAYLSSPLGGENWAKASFDLTPNLGGTDSYVDDALLKKGEMLATTTGFTPDLGDTIPGGFGSAEWEAIVNYVNGQDLDTNLANVATAQMEALGK